MCYYPAVNDEAIQPCRLLAKKLELLKKLEEEIATVKVEIAQLTSHAYAQLTAKDNIDEEVCEGSQFNSSINCPPATDIPNINQPSTDFSKTSVTGQESPGDGIQDVPGLKSYKDKPHCNLAIMSTETSVLKENELSSNERKAKIKKAPAITTIQEASIVIKLEDSSSTPTPTIQEAFTAAKLEENPAKQDATTLSISEAKPICKLVTLPPSRDTSEAGNICKEKSSWQDSPSATVQYAPAHDTPGESPFCKESIMPLEIYIGQVNEVYMAKSRMGESDQVCSTACTNYCGSQT